jgi:DNA replication protein DnaC
MDAKSTALILPQIVGTLEQSKGQPTTVKPEDKSSSDKTQSARDGWVNHRLKMNLYHPQLKAMASDLYSFIQDVFYSRNRGAIIILYGPNGCGKTHAARSVAQWFNAVRMKIGPVLIEGDVTGESDAMIPNCIFENWPSIVDGFKRDQWLIADMILCEYLVILDDIGAEHDPSGIGLDKLYVMLNRRERKHTILTTNYSPAEWEHKFERRIASRLFRNTVHVDMSQVPDFSTTK